MHRYRTTFTADPIVADAIQKKAKKEHKSISAVINEMLKTALGVGKAPQEKTTFKVEAIPLGLRPGLDPTRLRDVLSDIESGLL